MSVGSFWVVAQAKPQRERWAVENILRQGFEPYRPLTRVKEVKRGKVVEKLQSLFPGYLFVRTTGQWRSLTGTFGISGVIMAGQFPAIMPDSAIEQLRAREAADGTIILPKSDKPRFYEGEHVRIGDGPFSGYNGIFEGDAADERVSVLLQVLGRTTRVLIGEEFLEAV